MREILFKGKRKDNGEWIYGFAIFADNKAFILNNAKVEFVKGFNENRLNFILIEVIPETVGQFTGLTDKSGKRIFEGDIVKDSYGDSYVIKYGRCGLSCCGCCYHSHDSMGFYLCSEEGYALSDEDVWDNLEIIGNIAERRC